MEQQGTSTGGVLVEEPVEEEQEVGVEQEVLQVMKHTQIYCLHRRSRGS